MPQKDKIFIVHACGRVKEFLSSIKDTGVDGWDSLCPPPTGNTPMDKAKKVWGDDLIIIGLVEPSLFAHGTHEQLTAHVRELLFQVAPGRSFIMSCFDAGVPTKKWQLVMLTTKNLESIPLI